MNKEDIIKILEQQLKATNDLKSEHDKEIKRSRKTIQDLIQANKSLQEQSERLWKQIQDIKNNSNTIPLGLVEKIEPDISLGEIGVALNNASYFCTEEPGPILRSSNFMPMSFACANNTIMNAPGNGLSQLSCNSLDNYKKKITVKDKTYTVDLKTNKVEEID